MRVMGVDGATGLLSISFIVGTGLVAGWQATRPDPSQLIGASEKLLGENQATFESLDFLAVGRGPGAFTGVRMAVACAHGLSLGSGLPIIAVSDLLAVAWKSYTTAGQPDVHEVLATLDARQGQVYWAEYRIESGSCHCVSGENLSRPGDIRLACEEPIFVAGPGTTLVLSATDFQISGCDSTLIPDAFSVALSAVSGWGESATEDATKLTPVYLRDSVAKPPSRKGNNGLLR